MCRIRSYEIVFVQQLLLSAYDKMPVELFENKYLAHPILDYVLPIKTRNRNLKYLRELFLQSSIAKYR